MSLFKKLFSKEEKSTTTKGFYSLKVKAIRKLSLSTSEIQFEVPENIKQVFQFTPGQYLDFSININGTDERRSYSICSGKNEPLAVAVKKIENGKVSTWMNSSLKVGDEILVASPKGNFILKSERNIVAIAAGSGITPILSIAKEIEGLKDGSVNLFYASKTESEVLFKSELDSLNSTTKHYFLSQEINNNFKNGRISKTNFTEEIKSNLELLKADGFFLCGPEEMIFDVKQVLEMFGVAKEKIHFELFKTPTQQLLNEPSETKPEFTGKSKVTVIVDEMEYSFDLEPKGKSILDKADMEGADAPYSCRGGVCSTCKAKVLKGKATMKLNYSLTDQEIADGYVLACQAHPASEEVILSFDE